ncbi:MAG TPA: hypothetical protein VEV38_03520 [Candidatus Eremiobacteraceae bacterium]|nr:hypothetical protein [Candidatus Eremiobacteraceae bacterium]
MNRAAALIGIAIAMLCSACSQASAPLPNAAIAAAQQGLLDSGSTHWRTLPSTNCLNFGVASDGVSALWVPAACFERFEYRHRFIIRIGLDGTQHRFMTPTAESCPGGPALGPNGNIWFAEGCVGKIAEIAVPSGPITEFPLTSSKEAPWCVTAGADGNVWYGATNRRGTAAVIGRMTTTGSFVEFPLTLTQVVTAITRGPDGNVWFVGETYNANTQSYEGHVGKVTPGGAITEYSIPSSNGGYPGGIIAGPDGNLWVAATNGIQPASEIVKVTTAGQMTEYAAVDSGSIALGGPRSLYFSAGDLGQITVGGTITMHAHKGVYVDHLTQGPDGNEWLIQQGGNGAVNVYIP